MRILQLTNYPTVKPMHGGQIRCYQIANELRNAGHTVRSMAIYQGGYANVEIGKDDLCFPHTSLFYDARFPWLSDYFSGIFLEKDPVAFKKLKSFIKDFDPEIIISEQPWVFAAAKAASKKRAKHIYSSQNIEWRLKESIFEKENLNEKKLVEQIKNIETNAVKNADLIIACTDADAIYYKQVIGSKEPSIVTAGNGVEPFNCSSERVECWKHFFKNPMAIFVSSAHMPNAQGFWDMMAPGLTFLKPGEQILIVGGVTNILTQAKGFRDFASLNLSRLNMAGVREKIELQELVRASHVVLLPISDGEGSNLKTAEALESGCKIVGTTKAFRGFEAAMSSPSVTIADSPDAFRSAIRKALDAPRYEGGTPYEIRSKYYWDNTLKSIVKAISQF